MIANVKLNAELEYEYEWRGKTERLKYRRDKGNSTVAFKRFYGSEIIDGKTAADNRREYFEEMAEAIEAIEAHAPEPRPKPAETYEDVMEQWGATWDGQSLVLPHQAYRRTKLVGEL